MVAMTAEAHQLLAVAGQSEDALARLGLRQSKRDQRGAAHGAPEIEIAVVVADGMKVVGGRAEAGDDQRVLAVLQECRDGGAAIELGGNGHRYHHFFLPIRRCPIRTAICWSDS